MGLREFRRDYPRLKRTHKTLFDICSRVGEIGDSDLSIVQQSSRVCQGNVQSAYRLFLEELTSFQRGYIEALEKGRADESLGTYEGIEVLVKNGKVLLPQGIDTFRCYYTLDQIICKLESNPLFYLFGKS